MAEQMRGMGLLAPSSGSGRMPTLPAADRGPEASRAPTDVPIPRMRPSPGFVNPLTHWPVPGYTELNPGNAAVGEGVGTFGSPRGSATHAGIDITAPVGTPVHAAGSGKIIRLPDDPTGYGKQILVNHGNGMYTHYGHLDGSDLPNGAEVNGGDVIAKSGRTGNVPENATPHVHTEVRFGSPNARSRGGTIRNPLDYLPDPRTGLTARNAR